jgi:hypothetical protein
VLSAGGAPMPNLNVLARSTANPGSMYGATTGPDGSYRVDVPPGQYTVKSGDIGMVAPHEQRLASIYELHDAVESQPVVVNSGAEVVVDLWLPPAAVLYSATITVLDDAGQPAKDVEVEVFWNRDPLTPNLARSSFLGLFHTDGEPVVLRPTLPGPITVIARSLSDVPLAGIVPFDLQAASRQIRVSMQAAARILGRVEFVGRDIPVQGGDGIRVIFQPLGSPLNLNSIATRTIEPDGNFTMNGLIGTGCLRIYGLPAGWRLRGIFQEGVDLTDRVIALEPGDVRSDVVVRVEPGEPAPSWEVRKCS